MITTNNTNVNFGKFPIHFHLLFGITKENLVKLQARQTVRKANIAMQQAVQTVSKTTAKATKQVANDFYQPAQKVARFNPLSEFFEGISRLFRLINNR